MTFDIIIPHYGSSDRLTELCRRCLETIREHSTNYRLIFVDNGSPQFDDISEELARHPHLLIRNRENIGFVKATNEGLWASRAQFVVLMNNDTEAVPGWLDKLRAPLTGDVGLSGPHTTTRLSWQGSRPQGKGIEILNPGSMLAFFCVMIRRDVLDKCGVLDEEFGVGFADDDHFCWKAQQAGFRLAYVSDLTIPHHHRSTFKSLYSPDSIVDQQWENYAIYWRKRAPSMTKDEIQRVLNSRQMRGSVVSVLQEALAARG